jgi:CRP-like cAMP-binding protein
MQQQERLAALKRVPILAGLSQMQLEQIAGICRWKNYNAGERILNYHDPSTDVFFLAAGKVRVGICSAEGKVVVFTDLRRGTMFGEIAAIDQGPRSAGVEAIEPSTIASLTASQFESLLLREPAVAVATLRHVTAEVRRLSERVLEFSTLVVQNRIHAELLRLAADAGHRNGQALLSPAPSLSDIANRISTHREAVSRELSRLGSVALLRREGGNLQITDIARLEKLVRDAKGE